MTDANALDPRFPASIIGVVSADRVIKLPVEGRATDIVQAVADCSAKILRQAMSADG